jgi:hypothetical protein
MTSPEYQVIRIDVTITDGGTGARRRVFEALASATDASELMARISKALPEFETTEWATDYM